MDYIEKYQRAVKNGLNTPQSREIVKNFYTNAKMDISRAIIRGDISLAKDNIHDIIEKRKRLTDDEKHYIITSDRPKEDLAIEYNCTVAFIAKLRRNNKV